MRAILLVFLMWCCHWAHADVPAEAPTTVTQLIVQDEKPGSGAPILAGQVASVTYKGWLFDGKAKDRKGQMFDQGLDPAHPLQFTVGRNQVIKGFDQGMSGMHVGGKRMIYIPADMGYGAGGVPGHIPPNATLIFEVELQSIH